MKRRSAHLRLDALDESMRDVRRELAEVKGDVSVLKADVSMLKTDVSVLKTDVSVLKADVSVLKTDVAGLKTDVAEIKSRLDRDLPHLISSNLLVSAQLERLHRTMLEEFTRMADRFEAEQDARENADRQHEERLTRLENRVDRLERKK